MTQEQTRSLRRYRKQIGLSQHDMAFLLGCGRRCGNKVSRYEQLRGQPSLETALAYEVIFSVPVHELFPGILSEVEENVRNRAHHLCKDMRGGRANARKLRKLRALRALADGKGGTPAHSV